MRKALSYQERGWIAAIKVRFPGFETQLCHLEASYLTDLNIKLLSNGSNLEYYRDCNYNYYKNNYYMII